MVPVFQSGAVHPEAHAAVLLFQQAAEAEQVTSALLNQVAARLRAPARSDSFTMKRSRRDGRDS